MRQILLLISACVLASTQDCGPLNTSYFDDYGSPVDGNPCWRISQNQDDKEYSHKGKNLTIKTSDKEKSVMVFCDGQIIDCSWLPTLDFAKGGQLKGLEFRNCGLNGSISCVLRALNANGLTTLFLSHWGMEITTETLRGLDGLKRFMVYDSEAITKIPVNAFKQLPTLQEIRLSGNNISSIPANTFSELVQLNITFLEISRAKLTELQSGGFEGLPRLVNLSLFNNGIRTMEKDSFKGLPLLETLVLEDNPIEDLPGGVFSHNPNLKSLDLLRNRAGLRLRKDTLSGLTKLESALVHILNNHMFKLGLCDTRSCIFCEEAEEAPLHLLGDCGALMQKHSTHLSKHLLSPDELRDITLKKFLQFLADARLEITMYDVINRLSLEDQCLSGLPSLRYCDLSAAGLQELPKDLFRGTQALEHLKLDDNELRLLPVNVFQDLVNLKELSLSRNKLQYPIAITSSIYDGPFSTTGRLETLNLARNDLKNLSRQVFIGASSLKNLDLSYNQLKFDCKIENQFPIDNILEDSPLAALDDLLTLDLSHNNLTSICSDFLFIMTRLKKLNLSYNKIPALTGDDVHFLGNGIVDLRYNQITSIQPKENLKVTLLLGNNPYNCNCTNFKVLRELKNLKYDMSDANCSEPKSLEGVPLISIAEARDLTSLDNLTCVLPDTPNKCDCLARPSKKMTECICDVLVTDLPDPNNIRNYYFIDHEVTKYNMLLKLKTIDKLENLPNFVTNLSLSNLALKNVPNIPEHIRYVDLSYNNLESIPLELLSRNLTFNLNHNPFKCSCAGQSDINNLQIYKYKIYDYSSLVCHDGLLVGKIQVPHLCDVFFSIVIGITISIAGLLLAVLIILAFKYQLEIKIWLYNQGWTYGLFNYENALDASKKYDIFLSYCHEDEDYIVNELLPSLDAKYNVCVHTRDFTPGDDIITQIYRAVADSRRTVIVASKAYFKSPWCLEEMRAAYKQTEVDQRIRAVVILRTDVDPKSEDISETVRSYLNLNTWISEKDPRFWYRLCYFLPRDVTVEDLRLIKVTNEAKRNLSGQLNKVFVHDGKLGIDNETVEINSNLARNLRGVNKADNISGLNEVQVAINNLPGGLDAVCNNGKLAKNLPETLNVVHNEEGKLVNVAVVKTHKP